MNAFRSISSKLGSSKLKTGGFVATTLLGSYAAFSTMPTSPIPFMPKLHATTTTSGDQDKPTRKPIHEEDGAIFLSSLSVLQSRKDTYPKWDKNWDKRDPDSLVKPLKEDPSPSDVEKRETEVLAAQPKVNRTIILVRHGQYNLKATKDADRHLTELGRQQADITGQRLASLIGHLRKKIAAKDENGNNPQLDVKIVKSTMTRATQTADIILKHFPDVNDVSPCDLIREGAPCPPDPPFPEWDPTPSEFFIEGSRIEAGFRKYIHRADPLQENASVDVLVCHGNVIRYFVCRALQFPPEAWLRFALHNGSITVMTINRKGDVIVSALGESGHLPVESLTHN